MASKRWPRRAVVGLALATAVLGVDGCGGRGADKAGGSEPVKPVVLTLANSNGTALELQPFAAAVARLSRGTLRIRFANAWRDGEAAYEAGVIRDVAAGRADLGWAGTRAFDDIGVTTFDALHAPLLIDSYDLQRRVLAAPFVGRMLRGLEPAGLAGIGILPGPMRHPLGAAPLAGAADYRGRAIALNRSQVGARSLRALGAEPREIARGGPVEGFDGVEQQLESVVGNGYDRVAPYLTANVSLWPRPIVLFANPRTLRRLDERQRGALRAAVRAARPAVLAVDRAADADAAAILCRRGRPFVLAGPQEIAGLRAAVQPVYDRLGRDPFTRAAIAQIIAMRGTAPVAARDEAPTCRERAATPPEASGVPIDGRYRFTLTSAELAAELASAEELVPENYGRFEWEIDRGRFAWHQRNGSSAWEDATGTYALRGDRVTFTVRHVEGRHPTGSAARPGERFSFRWSRYRDQLTLRAVAGAVSPPGLTAKPWRRVGDAHLPAGAPPRTGFDGVYRMVSRAHDRPSRAPLTPSNYGRWTFVFDRGRFAITQENREACTWGYGVYTVQGDRTRWTFTDGGGRSPDDAYNRPGERFDYRWSRFRDTVTLRPVKGAVSPDNFLVKPWRLMRAAPSRRSLSRHCLPPAAALR